ncbi:MAG: hypothetical protein R8M45_10760, partial [Ghiorsea sp.]
EADALANLIAVTYPVIYFTGFLLQYYPDGYFSNDGFGPSAVDMVRSIGQSQGFQSIAFQKVGLTSLTQAGAGMLATDPGGVWLSHGALVSDVSPATVTSSPSTIRLVISWLGTVAMADSLFVQVLMRALPTDPWIQVSAAQVSGSKPTAFTSNLGGTPFGNSPQIAARITAGIATDVNIDVVLAGK